MCQSENNPNLKNERSLQTTNFIQDDFFEKGHWWLKFRQVLLNLVFSLFLILPILILFNSISEERIWSAIYFWQYADGFQLSNYLKSFIWIAFTVILVFSLIFLFRNNYQEKYLYPQQMTYDEAKLEKRKRILEQLYSERFGTRDSRYKSKYYVVNSEQNFSDTLITDIFKQEGVAIK
ncbi:MULTISPECIES: hypothetical protein [unclassified Enterococcus]|uniref:hypothetical protein n=1 Tax=unclassified Enterococcus TaxID=2608891 RepID=UPI00155633BB|nr:MULTISPECIES: hypothetical protein [unclassified Enterococcus]MBS7576625.1 hypothetical protein [Enterococcus sp. MMGLQ5-2]MBS7583888.1 hypothetical protein [Enterococcus sp. MMGLQ5-1]NPD11749.1 hypothetical protein [Enterococcus sp. MMGLQ5-1]NPD36462.1 hypothetical protein [Enterococcus sp. MMGLQ5-2]